MLQPAERWPRRYRQTGSKSGCHGLVWHVADALAMAWALEPDAALDVQPRPLEIARPHGPARGMSVVDWNRQNGRADNVRILRRFDQARFEQRITRALRD